MVKISDLQLVNKSLANWAATKV